MRPNTINIAGRMTDLLRRQMILLEEMRADLPVLDSLPETPVANAQKRRETALAILAEEFELLKREWDETEGIPEDDRARIRALSLEVNERVAHVQSLLAESLTAVRDQLCVLESSIGDLRRGKQVMHAYKTRDFSEGGGLDRQG
jgi:hypothetical protein